MPGIDHSLPLQDAIIAHLKADAGLAAIVGARVYGPDPVPDAEWPFIRYGLPITGPWEATGHWRGMEGEVTIHGYAKGADDAPALTLAAGIVLAMESFRMDGKISCINMEWTRSQLIRDTSEAGAYHTVVQFDAGTVEVTA